MVPATTENARRIYNVEVKGKQLLATNRGNLWFHNSGQLLHVRLFDSENETLRGVIVLRTDDQQQLENRIDADSAHFSEEGWRLHDVVERRS